jgi:hypothetical protein
MSATTNERKEANMFKHDKWLNKKQHKQKTSQKQPRRTI